MEFTLNEAKINFKKAVELAKGFEGDWIARMALALKSDFDEEGSYNKAWSEWTDWDMGKTTAQFKVIK